MKRILLILFFGISLSYGKDNDSTEILLKQYKDMFSNGLINETEYTKLKQKVLFPNSSAESKAEVIQKNETDTALSRKTKKHYFFISPSFNNGGCKMVYYSGSGSSQIKSTLEKGYNFSANILFGYNINGFSISTGIKSKIYYTSIDFRPVLTNPNDPAFSNLTYKSIYYFISVPLMLDYDINIYKDKLFVSIGFGGEMNSLLRKNNSIDGKIQRDFLNKDTYNKFTSFGIIARTGLKYSANKRINIFMNFNYERNLISAYGIKAANLNNNFKAIPTSLSSEIGVNIKF